MLGYLLIVVVVGFAWVLVSAKMLAPDNPLRRLTEGGLRKARENPDLLRKAVERLAFVLAVLIFLILTLVYS
jgi:hypothetical protein